MEGGTGTHERVCSPQGGWPGRGGDEMKELKVKRMNINVEVSLHDGFKAATAAKGENMTDVLLRFIHEYVAKNGLAPKKKGRR
jgi:ParG